LQFYNPGEDHTSCCLMVYWWGYWGRGVWNRQWRWRWYRWGWRWGWRRWRRRWGRRRRRWGGRSKQDQKEGIGFLLFHFFLSWNYLFWVSY